MSLLNDVATWFGDADNWEGRSGIPARLLEHLRYSTAPVLAAIVVTGPIGLWLGHRRRFGTFAINIANVGQTLPSFAILVLAVQAFAFREIPYAGPLALFIAMTLLAIPPVFVNTYTGMSQVDDALRDSARGLGMTAAQQVWRVELPVAVPVILTGIRIAFVQVVATATLGAYLGAGGLGRYIIDGYSVRDYTEVFAGALLVGALALAADRVVAVVQPLLGFLRRRTVRRARVRGIA